MDRYADGDDAAFAEVYDEVAPRLYGFALRQTGDPSRAEDLVQQTLLQMHCARETYVTGADVFAWAFAIARRLSIDGFRRARREVVLEIEAFSGLAACETADEVAQSNDTARTIARELARVPASHRDAFELTRLDGVSVDEAAEMLGTTANAVRLRVHRTYEALRAALLRDATGRRAR